MKHQRYCASWRFENLLVGLRGTQCALGENEGKLRENILRIVFSKCPKSARGIKLFGGGITLCQQCFLIFYLATNNVMQANQFQDRQKIIAIDRGSQAESIGLKIGDIIESFDGVSIQKLDDLLSAMAGAANKGVSLTDILIIRDLNKQIIQCRPSSLGVELLPVICSVFDGKVGESQVIENMRHTSLKDFIASYVGQPIKVNAISPLKLQFFKVYAACNDHFVIGDLGLVIRIPYCQVLSTIERDIADINELSFPVKNGRLLSIEVNHLMISATEYGISYIGD